ncbi:hypothetical protein GUJ93_ZPchr0008g12991 [Zizania palustris]|uniref:Uncharacterized protein n=1 Tax=Zizania palustris TaxID=103762 RepID=A0A8J5RKH5_ZIZPA|nr:hypothetical protein GUJ93_ZPchr0008g12991 [Zizania palustris]
MLLEWLMILMKFTCEVVQNFLPSSLMSSIVHCLPSQGKRNGFKTHHQEMEGHHQYQSAKDTHGKSLADVVQERFWVQI